MNREKYCLQRHFAALYRQSKCHEFANFAEACEECKLMDKCKADWEKQILPLPEDIKLSVVCQATGQNKGSGQNCPDNCTDRYRHTHSPSFCSGGQANL